MDALTLPCPDRVFLQRGSLISVRQVLSELLPSEPAPNSASTLAKRNVSDAD